MQLWIKSSFQFNFVLFLDQSFKIKFVPKFWILVDIFRGSINISIDKIIEILKHRGMGSVRRSKAMFENAQIEAAQDKPSTPIQTRRMRLGLKIHLINLIFKTFHKWNIHYILTTSRKSTIFSGLSIIFFYYSNRGKCSDILPDRSAIDHRWWRCESRCANSRKLQGQDINKNYI